MSARKTHVCVQVELPGQSRLEVMHAARWSTRVSGTLRVTGRYSDEFEGNANESRVYAPGQWISMTIVESSNCGICGDDE